MFAEYDDHDAIGLGLLVARGEISAGELLETALARVETLNPAINAVVNIREEVARGLIAAGLPQGPFTGVPFLLKDLGAEARDFPSHNGSVLSRDTRYPGDSEIYRRIADSGMVTFGRTTSPEGGIGATTEAAVYGGPTRNPWNTERAAGGSSGGAGAAVAAGIVPAAHGSDGGGSVRIPASCCGLVGIKPTRARLPDGPYAGEGWAGMSIDGFLTRSLRDSATLLDLCHGPDLGAPYHPPPLKHGGFRAAMTRDPGRLRVAVCETTLTGLPIHADCRAAVQDAARLLEGMGHHVEPARPGADTLGMMQAWTRIVACGALLSLRQTAEARGREVAPGEVENVTRAAAEYGRGIGGDDYLAAVAKVHAYGREMAAFMSDHDLLLTATLAEPPTVHGRFDHSRTDFVDYRLGPDGIFAYSPFAAAFNASGQPAASVPLYWNAEGLPIGVHLAAGFGEDELLVSVLAELERARPWFARRPPLAARPG